MLAFITRYAFQIIDSYRKDDEGVVRIEHLAGREMGAPVPSPECTSVMAGTMRRRGQEESWIKSDRNCGTLDKSDDRETH